MTDYGTALFALIVIAAVALLVHASRRRHE